MEISVMFSVITGICIFASQFPAHGLANRTQRDRCLLFKSTSTDVYIAGQSAFIAHGPISVGEDFSMRMKIQMSALNPNGVLLSVGSQRNFPIQSFMGSFSSISFLVLEVSQGSVRLTYKVMGSRLSDYLEVLRTYPKAYDLTDGNFHNIQVTHSSLGWRLKVGEGRSSTSSHGNFNIHLTNKTAYIGGRPGYLSHQFRGVIQNVRINGRAVSANRTALPSHTQQTRCGSRKHTRFVNRMQEERHRNVMNSLHSPSVPIFTKGDRGRPESGLPHDPSPPTPGQGCALPGIIC